MKNIRILFGAVALIVFGSAYGFNLKDYVVGSRTDAEGRTLHHLAAENCDNIDRFFQPILVETGRLLRNEPIFKGSDEPLSVLVRNNNGETALDIAQKMYITTKNAECAQMVLQLIEQEKEEANSNKITG